MKALITRLLHRCQRPAPRTVPQMWTCPVCERRWKTYMESVAVSDELAPMTYEPYWKRDR